MVRLIFIMDPATFSNAISIYMQTGTYTHNIGRTLEAPDQILTVQGVRGNHDRPSEAKDRQENPQP
jgi:hypothetical protein